MQPLNIRKRFWLLGELPVLITGLVTQDLQPHHGHEPRPHHQAYSYLQLALLAPQDFLYNCNQAYGNCGNTALALIGKSYELDYFLGAWKIKPL